MCQHETRLVDAGLDDKKIGYRRNEGGGREREEREIGREKERERIER